MRFELHLQLKSDRPIDFDWIVNLRLSGLQGALWLQLKD